MVAFSLGAWTAALASCRGEPSGAELTVNASASGVTSSVATGGGMGGFGGAGGSATTDATTTTTGNGAGGMAEQPIHGCTSALAVDQTGAPTVVVNIPNGPLCVRMALGSDLIFTLDTPTAHRYRGGEVDENGVKTPDGSSPIASCCDISPFTCCPGTSDPIPMNVPGAYPWYDDKNPGTFKGVVYVE